MSEPALHIASAVVQAQPASQSDVAARIAALAGAEVTMIDRGRIIVVLEGDRHGALGEILAHIATMDGVLSATLVFEHSEGDSA